LPGSPTRRITLVPSVAFALNGRAVTATFEEGMSLLETLRSALGITSPKNGCSQGFCGCCTVLVDGRPALACLKRPQEVAGREVTTLEGIPEAQRQLLARAFVQEGGIQCGFCTPGILVRAKALLDRGKGHDRAAIMKALDAHLCRCTGYLRVADAIETAANGWHGDSVCHGHPRRAATFGARSTHDPQDAGDVSEAAPRVVGTSLPRYRGVEHALGARAFIADMSVPGMLHAAVVLSAHPRARILALDPAPALARPGVERVLTAADVAGERSVGLIVRDWPVFVAVGEITRCVGDVLAFVVADSEFRARRSAAAVRVEYEVLPPVTTPEAALAADAPRLHESGNLLETCAFARGDVDAALAASAHVVRQRFQTQRVEHAFLEPEACLAVPAGGALKVYSCGQGVHDDQQQIAAVLGVPLARVEVEVVGTGGAFGGKEDLSIQAQTALAAWLLKRPVRCVLTREQSILMHPKRHPLTLDYAAACDVEGHLTAVQARIVGDTGAYASVGAMVLERAAGHSCGPYRVPNVDIEAKSVYTNNPPSGAMRGFGANQAAFAIEGVMDMLAERVGIDRYEIRARNVLRPGDRFATGQIMTASCGISETLAAVRDVFKAARYAGIACGIKNTGIGNGMVDTGRVLLQVCPGERIEVVTGFTEMGQGLFTVLQQVVAHETGLDPACIEVATRSEPAALSGMTTASRATALATMATRRAAHKLAHALGSATLESLVGQGFTGEYVCDFTVKPGTAVDNPVTHMTFGYATQVVVLDDEGRLARVVAAHDVGRAINPLACVQQLEGAVHMGLGYALSEELPCTDGRPDSVLLRDLGILKASQMPAVDVILVEVPDEIGGYGAKGIGEIGLVPTAAAVAGALWAYDGIRRTRLPMRVAPAAMPVRKGAEKSAS
jgi:xanthine dehydrogenase molybdenum-binding subunit